LPVLASTRLVICLDRQHAARGTTAADSLCPGKGGTEMEKDIASLTQDVGALLRERHLNLAVAESCTAGLLGSYIVDVPGSSDYFPGGVIAYADDVKRRVLGVPGRTLRRHGAVSAEVALAMADGARRLLLVDVAVAVTGIAGPTGGTAEKPVGLTYIALCSAGSQVCRSYVWHGSRRENREQSARAALQLLREYLLALPEPATGKVEKGAERSQS